MDEICGFILTKSEGTEEYCLFFDSVLLMLYTTN
jgi:hypothetical protein